MQASKKIQSIVYDTVKRYQEQVDWIEFLYITFAKCPTDFIVQRDMNSMGE